MFTHYTKMLSEHVVVNQFSRITPNLLSYMVILQRWPRRILWLGIMENFQRLKQALGQSQRRTG